MICETVAQQYKDSDEGKEFFEFAAKRNLELMRERFRDEESVALAIGLYSAHGALESVSGYGVGDVISSGNEEIDARVKELTTEIGQILIQIHDEAVEKGLKTTHDVAMEYLEKYRAIPQEERDYTVDLEQSGEVAC